jgi:hypothetical protein
MLKLRSSHILVAVLLAGGFMFASDSAYATGAIAQSFSSTSANIASGALVGLVTGQNGTVQPATNTGASTALIGVAVGQPLLALLSSGQHSVQVAVSGTAQTMVSDMNGPISVGDRITSSPITGVGMKAVSSGEIVGTAQASLGSVTTVNRTITARNGKATSVKVGLIPVTVDVQYYSAPALDAASVYIPPIIQTFANTVAGKQIAPLRVLLGLLLCVFGSITVIIMLNAAIRSGIMSIGRNPLAERALLKGLVDVLLIALGIILISVVTGYAVLTA